jgi:hypothetical protein
MMLITAIISLIIIATPPVALCFTVDVKAGDWIEYDIRESLSVNSEYSQRLDFLSIEGSELTVQVTVIMLDGSQIHQNGTIDFGTSATNQDFSTYFLGSRAYLIPAGSEGNDSVYLGTEFGNRVIFGETTRAYAGADRTVVYSNFTLKANQYLLYWDKQTGVLVEALVEATMSAGAVSNSLLVIGTNMWSGGIGWWLWVIIGGAIVLGIVTSRKKVTGKLGGECKAQSVDKTKTE